MEHEKYYIARLCSVDEWDARHYHFEAIFSTYDKAYQYLLKIIEDEWDDWLGEIICLLCDADDPDDFIQEWTFSTKGELLDTYDSQNAHEGEIEIQTEDGLAYAKIPKPESFTGKYEVGDIVFIRARPWNKHGYPSDIIGVIGVKPISYEQWISDGKDKYDWDDEYIVYYIASGYLSHIHVEESGIQPYSKELPGQLLFLKRQSDHFTDKRPIPDDLWLPIVNDEMFIENVKHFPKEEY